MNDVRGHSNNNNNSNCIQICGKFATKKITFSI